MEFKQIMAHLIHELEKDKSEGSYYYSWQSNIAVSFQDAFRKYFKEKKINHSMTHEDLHTISNNAAKNFLDLLLLKPDES